MCSIIFCFSNFPSKCKRMSIYIRRSSAVKFKIIHILIMMHSLVKLVLNECNRIVYLQFLKSKWLTFRLGDLFSILGISFVPFPFLIRK